MDYFIHIKDSKIVFLNSKGQRVDRITIFGEPLSEGAFNDIDNNDDKIDSQQTETAQNVANNSEFVNNLHSINEEILKNNRKFVIFFEDFEWTTGLYSNEPNLTIIKYFKMWRKAKNSVTILSIKNLEHLVKFDIDIDEDSENMINISTPSVNEIVATYFRYVSRNSKTTEIEHKELENISASIQKDKKSLREAMRILKETLKLNPPKIKFDLFKDKVSKNLEEEVRFEDVVLEKSKKNEILTKTESFKNMSKNRSKGIILYGPSGTGKTYISKAIATEYNMNFMAPSLADLKGEYIGQTSGKIKRIFDEARANAPTIMFLDEIDTIFTMRSSDSDGDSFTRDMVNQFLVEIDGAKTGRQDIFIIGATNRLKSIDFAILSRLQPQIEIPLPNKSLREKIFDSKFEKFKLSEQNWKENILEKTAGMSGRDIDEFVKVIKELVHNESDINYVHFTQGLVAYEQNFVNYFETEMNNALSIRKDDLLKFDDIIGYQNEKDAIQSEADFIKSDIEKKTKMKQFGIEPERGTLLYGPPGNGKTTLAESFAGENNFYFIKVLSKSFNSPISANSLNKIEKIFENSIKLANMATDKDGVVLFFDEIDTLISAHMDRTVRGTLLDFIENKNGIKNQDSKVILIAATNSDLRELDAASIRSGRFDKKLLIQNPKDDIAIDILHSFFKKDENIELTKDKEYFKKIYKNLRIKLYNNVSIADLKNEYKKIKNESYFKTELKNGKIKI